MVARILIVEDQAETARHIADVLAGDGFDPYLASTGEEGLARLEVEAFDVLIVDHYLPLKSGLEVLREARRRWPSMPVLFMTAPGHPDVAAAAVREGAFACVEKHLNYTPLLVERIRDALGNRSLRTAPRHLPAFFVGRTEELRHLERALAEAREGEGRLVMLLGEAGIGKSALALQVRPRARDLGFLTATGRCRAREGGDAYAPWLEIYRACRQRLAGDAPSDASSGPDYLAHLVAQLESTLPERWHADLGESRSARLVRFQRIFDHFRELAAREPLAIILEDVHLIDSGSLELLSFVAERLSEAAVFILATMRQQPRQAAIEAELERAVADAGGYRMALPPFSSEDIATALERIVQRRPTPADVAFLFDRTEGHPLFTVELLQILAKEGRLESVGNEGLGGDLPTTRVGAIDRRLRLLPAVSRQVLRIAALIGRQFGLSTLQDAAADLAPHVPATIEEALRHQLLLATDDSDELRFANALFQEELARGWTQPERATTHRRIGEAIERSRCNDLQPYLATLAHHFLEAGRCGDPERGVRYAIQAADRQAALMALREAIALYESALRADALASILTQDERCGVLTGLSEARWAGGNMQEAREAGREALALARELDGETVARAALAFAGQLPGYGAVTSDAEVVEALEYGIARVGETRPGQLCLLLVRLADELTFSPEQERRFALVSEARRLATAAGDTRLEVAALRRSLWTLWLPEDAPKRRELADRFVVLAQQTKDRVLCLDGELLRVWSALEHGDPRLIERHLRRSTELARSSRLAYYEWLALLAEACVALTSSHLEEFRELADQAHVRGSASGNENATLFYGVQWAHLQWLRGEFATVGGWLEEIARGYPTLAMSARAGRAIGLSESGNLDEARRALRDLGDGDLASLPRNVSWLLNASQLAEVAARTGSRDASARLYDALAPLAPYQVLLPPMFTFGPVAHHLGNLATTLGRWEEAERYFHTALEAEKRLGCSHWLARTKIEYARLLLSRPGGAGELDPTKLLEEARVVARQLDLPGWLSRCDEVAGGATAGMTSPRAKHHCLFRRLQTGYLIVLDGVSRQLKSYVGNHHLYALVRQKDQNVSASDLRVDATGGDVPPQGDGGPAIDRTAKQKIDVHIQQLLTQKEKIEEELEEYQLLNDRGWIETLQARLSLIEDELEDVCTYRKDDRRRLGSSRKENARQSVQKSIMYAIAVLDRFFPELAEHFRQNVKTGYSCVYLSDPDWVFEL